MELYQQLYLFLFIFLFAVALFFVYTQFNVNRKHIRIITASGKTVELDVEIADDPAKRMRGLMFRSSIGEYEGMLFMFDKSEKHRFWMVNTTIPLDAIHFDENMTVVDIVEMEPCPLFPCEVYVPKKESRYVLEVNQGFSKKHNITEGSRFSFS